MGADYDPKRGNADLTEFGMSFPDFIADKFGVGHAVCMEDQHILTGAIDLTEVM